MNDVFVSRLRLPLAVKGMVATTAEGDYQIILNDAYDSETQRQVYNHEMRHILMGHLHTSQQMTLELAEHQANDASLLCDGIRQAATAGFSGRFPAPPPAAGPTPTPPSRLAAAPSSATRHGTTQPAVSAGRAARLARGMLCGLHI